MLAMGRRMRDALVADLAALRGLALTVAACPSQPPAPAGQAVWPAPGETVANFVARQARQHAHCWVIAPETGQLLAQLQQQVPATAWRGCSAGAIALASSKSHTLALLHARGIPTPLALAELATRWVIKPDDGAGAVNTRVYTQQADALAALAVQHSATTPMTLEPWVEGTPGSLSLLVPPDGQPGGMRLLSVNRQQITVAADGALAYQGVAPEPAGAPGGRTDRLRQLARAVVAAVPGLAGFVGLDFVWHPQHGPVVIELNPRLTCAYAGLSAALGRNLAADWLAMHRALPEPVHG